MTGIEQRPRDEFCESGIVLESNLDEIELEKTGSERIRLHREADEMKFENKLSRVRGILRVTNGRCAIDNDPLDSRHSGTRVTNVTSA